MINAIKRFFGFGQPASSAKPPLTEGERKDHAGRKVVNIKPVSAPAPGVAIQKIHHTRANVNRSQYYRRRGEYYNIDDDSIVMDLALTIILMEMFSAEDDLDYEALITEHEIIEPETTSEDIDVAVEAVARSYGHVIPEPSTVVDTEPTYDSYSDGSSPYSGGSEYSGSSSTYSGGSDYSGSSDSGGSDSSSD